MLATLALSVTFLGGTLNSGPHLVAFSSSTVAPRTVTSSRWMSLDGLSAYGIGGENVALRGKVHLVTRVALPSRPLEPLRIDAQANLANASGIGMTSGLRYSATGSLTMEPFFQPAGPPLLPTFLLEFRLKPPPPPGGGVPIPYPLVLGFATEFDDDGNLLESSVYVHVP